MKIMKKKDQGNNQNQGFQNMREQYNPYQGYVFGYEGGDHRVSNMMYFDPNYHYQYTGMQVPEDFQEKENVQNDRNDKKYSGEQNEGNHTNMMHGPYPYPYGYPYNFFPPPIHGYVTHNPNSVPQPSQHIPYRFPMNPYRQYPPYEMSHVRGSNNDRNNNQEEYIPQGNYYIPQYMRIPYNNQ